MTYHLIEEHTLDFTGGPMDPKGWAIHWWGDPNQRPTFAGILNVLITRSAQKSASVNFMAESGLVACLVSPFTKAWAQGDGGNGWGNNNLVSLECNPRCTAEDRETVAELIADQNIINGIPIVLYPHNKFTATQCPGVWEQWMPWIAERAKQIVVEKTTGVKPKTEPVKDDKMLFIVTDPNDGTGMVWIGDGVTRRHIPDPAVLQHYRNVSSVMSIFKGGEIQNWPPEVIGVDVQNTIVQHATKVAISSGDLDKLVTTLKESLAPDLARELSKRLAD